MKALLFWFLLFLSSAAAHAAELRAHLVFIIGENEYHTWESLPEFAQHLDTNLFRCTFVSATPKEGDNRFIGFQAIDEADLLFISVRRRTPPKDMMAAIRRHLAAGKPLVGIRTASHAFGADPPDSTHEGWNSFDIDVLGCNYQGHYNNGNSNLPGTRIEICAESSAHPVLSGIPNQLLMVTSHLYKNRDPSKSVEVLLRGQAKGENVSEPVAWVNTNANRRVFYTSLGSPDDFRQSFFRRLLLNGICWALGNPALAATSVLQVQETPGAATQSSLALPRASVPQDSPLSPKESLERFQIAGDLQIDQVLSEPVVRQPVFLNFDERGRMWVVEYLQYPYPAGLRMLSHDSVWRAVYDRVPPPPPHHFVGADKITIHESTRGDGVFDKHTTFLEGLNIVTSVARGRGGVWVLNPPYLLFYPDRNNDDVPDGDPEVVLSGFGLEDTHSVANSLRWGPDGWLYACQGSTVTADIIRPGLDKQPLVHTMGQQIWRYHPETRRFEVFSEGGGNAFGCEIDEKGRVFSGHNGGNTRGFHYMQGAYLEKGFDKHGPLSNPYAYGYFPPMPHPAVERFTHNFIIYAGGSLPSHYDGKLFGIEPLQGRVVQSEILPMDSSFKTRDIDYPVSTGDRWFRPVDIKVGPDGAIYVADWYDSQVNHYRNHEGRIDKNNGRIYRLKATGAEAIKPFDLARLSNVQLIGLLHHTNKWFRQESLRLIGDRADASLVPLLNEMVRTNSGQLALESLWALNLSGGFNDDTAFQLFSHSDPFVRLWTVRLLGDRSQISPALSEKLNSLAAKEDNVEVRAQLACAAKRLPAPAALALIKVLLARAEDVGDSRIPLLLWWALESKCEQNREEVVALFDDVNLWRWPIVQQSILERLMRRFAQAGTRRDFDACAGLLKHSPGAEQNAKLITGFELAFKGRSEASLPEDLVAALTRAGRDPLILGLRHAEAGSVKQALDVIANPKAPLERRLRYLEILGEVHAPDALPVLLRIFQDPAFVSLQQAILGAFQPFDAPSVGEAVVAQFASLTNTTQTAAMSLLVSRAVWTRQLLEAVNTGRISRGLVPQDAVEKIKAYSDATIQEWFQKLWGNERKPTTAEMQRSIEHFAQTIRNSEGNPYEGRKLFGMSCALCHKLFGQGAQIGPDLTPYKRDDLETMLLNVINPNAEIREGYETYLVTTKDGRTLSGFLADKDNRVVVLRGIDGINQVLDSTQIETMKSSGLSLMPESLLSAFNDQQVCDLFAYLRCTQPLVGEPPPKPSRATQ